MVTPVTVLMMLQLHGVFHVGHLGLVFDPGIPLVAARDPVRHVSLLSLPSYSSPLATPFMVAIAVRSRFV